MNKRIITLILSTGILINVPAVQSNSENNFYTYKPLNLVAFELDYQQKIVDNALMELQKDQERKQNVKFNSYDITQISNITYDEMKEVLSESHYSNFAEISDAFVDAEKEYGINAFALVAIAGLESGWNTSERANNGRNNIVGMAVYNDDSYGSVYESKYHCIMDLANQLKDHYLNNNGMFFNGTGTKAINKKYSENSNWYKSVDSIGDELMQIYNEKFRDGKPY